jgi:class 3 adenylate cyclase
VTAIEGYAKNGDVHIAFHVMGEGPRDLLVFTRGYIPIDCLDEEPHMARCLRRLSSFSRVILLDRRGIGLSDPVGADAPPTLEQWMGDALAVLDEVGSSRASLLATGDTGPLGMLTAAAHPERVTSLVLVNTAARVVLAPDYPVGVTPEQAEDLIDALIEGPPGSFDFLRWSSPSVAEDQRFRDWWERAGHRGASPATARMLNRLTFETDVRELLAAIRVPTLVLHRAGNRLFDVGHGRYLAERIPDAHYVELEGKDDLWWVGPADPLIDEVEEFLTGTRLRQDADRVVTTLLFTDIVGSTDLAARLGDRTWRDLLGDHEAMVRRQLARFDGVEIKTMGDGFLARFDGPARAIRCACAIRDGAHQLGAPVRLGLHTGEVEVMGDDVGGIAVHIGQRVSALAGSGEVLVSSTVKDLVVGSGIEFADHGEEELRGVPGAWRLFSVVS